MKRLSIVSRLPATTMKPVRLITASDAPRRRRRDGWNQALRAGLAVAEIVRRTRASSAAAYGAAPAARSRSLARCPVARPAVAPAGESVIVSAPSLAIKPVADAGDGLDHRRVAELLAQGQHRHPDRVRERIGVLVPRLFQQLLGTDNPAF